MQQTVGQKIRYLRQVRGLSQKELAEGLSSPSMISQIESDRATPSVQLLNRLAERLQTTMNYFFIDQSIHQQNFSGLLLARSYAEEGRLNDAVSLLEHLDCTVMESTFADEVDYLRAVYLWKIGDVSAAQIALEQLLTPERAALNTSLQLQVLLALGRIFYLRGDCNAALLHLLRAVEAAAQLPEKHLPELGQVYEAMGQVYEAREDWQQAEQAYGMAQDHYLLEHSMEEVSARKLKQAEQNHEAGRYEQAILDCQAYLSITSIRQHAETAAHTAVRRAIVLGQAGQLQEASYVLNNLAGNREWFEENAAQWHLAMAQVELAAGNFEAAYERLSRQFPADSPGSPLTASAFTMLGSILLQWNRLQEAQVFLLAARSGLEACSDNSGLINCNKLLSTLYKATGNYEAALECHDRIHELMAAHLQDHSWNPQFALRKEGISR